MTERTMLFYRSIEIIKNYQSESGAYVASPNFENYQYCWLRDGSFTAYAMDCLGEYQSSKAYHRWVSQTIMRYAHKVDHISACLEDGKQISGNDFLHTRYFLDGCEDPEDSGWGNFQVDGYGSWLWAVGEHIRRTGDFNFYREIQESIYTCIRYVSLVYKLPCYDLWEENPELLHTYSLGAVYGGIEGVSRLNLLPEETLTYAADVVKEIGQILFDKGVESRKLVKFIGVENGKVEAVLNNCVDSSLIGLCTPYGVFSADNQVVESTLDQIEEHLVDPEGGVYRYAADTYYGGGQWVLLAGWLAWHYGANGRKEEAQRLISWMEAQADDEFQLPEQVSSKLLFPEYLGYWEEKWGQIAKPLLWSHAMYLIAVSIMND